MQSFLGNVHKEYEFRFNHKDENMYQILFKLFRDEYLKLFLIVFFNIN
jgi:hypothetical protein